ncbi:MAG: DHH family phosphoesterase [Candidatus Hodarchaeales archaeon]|jgi:nanoRNase/pAp phosphatase (c-di-AMP/oligoRNAs hydrolase)
MGQEFRYFFEYLKENKNNIVLILHTQADPDAVGSAIALIHFIKTIKPVYEVKIFQPELSALSERLLHLLNYRLPITEEINDTDLVMFIDNSNINDFDLKPDNKIIVIDHHVKQEKLARLLFDFRFESSTSTAEIIARLYKRSNVPLIKISVQSIIAGIVFDTRRFLFANTHLFKLVNYLLYEFPEVYDEILALFTSTKSRAERIACIKAAQRIKRLEVQKIQILISHVSSFEAAAARSLILLGGDVVIVVSYQGSRSRISLRSTTDFFKTTNISLGKDLIPKLINKYGGTGGGHDGAAGYNLDRKINLKEFTSFVSNFISTKLKE